MNLDPSQPLVGESTEEIPVVAPAAPGPGRADGAREPDEVLGVAGSLRGLRFNGRTLVRALVLAAWAVALLVISVAFYPDLASLAPDVPRWWVVTCGMVLAVLVVVVLSDVDEPDVEDGSAGHEFHELDWSRRELYAVRPVDILWAFVEVAPLVVILATMWR